MRIQRNLIAISALVLSLQWGPAWAQEAQEGGQLSAKNMFLAPIVSTVAPALAQELSGAIVEGIRWFFGLFKSNKPAQQASAPSQYSPEIQNTQQSAMPNFYSENTATNPAPSLPAEMTRPGEYIKLFKLAAPEEVKEVVPVDGGQLRTNDRFIIEFMTNTPGVVKIINQDSAGAVSNLGTFMTQGGGVVRLPEKKAFRLVGTPGTESYELTFTPCRQELQGKATINENIDPANGLTRRDVLDQLPSCSGLQRGLTGKGTGLKPKMTINENQSDGSMFAVAPEPGFAGGPIMTRFSIQHVTP